RSGRHELLDDGRLGTVAEDDPCATDQGAAWLTGRPADGHRGGPEEGAWRAGGPGDDDRVGQVDAGRDVEADALVPEPSGERGQLLVVGEVGAAFDVGAEPVRVAGERGPEGLEHDATRRRLG